MWVVTGGCEGGRAAVRELGGKEKKTGAREGLILGGLICLAGRQKGDGGGLEVEAAVEEQAGAVDNWRAAFVKKRADRGSFWGNFWRFGKKKQVKAGKWRRKGDLENEKRVLAWSLGNDVGKLGSDNWWI